MAQAKRKRRRKHRGTPAGTIERPGRTGPGRTRQDAKAISRERRRERMNRPPTWRGAINRAAIAALIFGVLALVLKLADSAAAAVLLTLFVFVIYVPLGYGTDLLLYRLRQRRKAK